MPMEHSRSNWRVSTTKLNATKILSTELPIPCLTEQRRIVKYLEKLQSEVSLLHRMQAETALELDALLPSVLVRRSRRA
jgi:restriction endonuclease S subunit